VRCMRAIEAVSRRQKKWQELIRQQEQSKLSVTAFCREHRVSDQSFYNWRKRLSGSEPVRFALVEGGAPVTNDNSPIELIRISPGIDVASLRTVLSVLRERA
jgi:transposase-like protein